MKLKFTFSAFTLLLLSIVLMSNSGGRAASTGEGNTGAPGDDAFTCGTCHIGGTFGTSIDIKLLDATGAEVSEYTAGSTYTVQASVNTTTAPVGYGLQLVSLIDDGNVDTDGLSAPSANAKLVPLASKSRTYLEQTSLSSSEVFSATWTAPAANSGSVTFYASGHAANGNGQSGGDQAANGSFNVAESVTSSTFETAKIDLQIFPNPTTDFANLTFSKSMNTKVELMDLSGRTLQSVTQVSDNVTLSLQDYTSGNYVIVVTDIDEQTSEVFQVIKK